jgi:GNAT superfamily N-acetyltransferase
VTIRSAEVEDLPRIVGLLEFGSLVEGKEDPSAGPAYASALEEIRSTPGCDVLVAETDGEVVGTCQLIVFRHLQARGGRCAEIESMHVHPDHRGQGIGTQLLAAAVEAARSAGCNRVQLTSNLKRPDAHRFYEREGFTASHVGFKQQLDPG